MASCESVPPTAATAVDVTDHKAGPGVTFQVEPDIKLGGLLPRKEPDALRNAWKEKGPKGGVEGCSSQPEAAVMIFTERNLLAEAVHQAFYKHYPLILSPDVIWLTVAQGLARHVELNAETLRHKFVDFEGKKTISIIRPGFSKGNPHNDWPGVFPEFSEKIASYIGNQTVEMIECNFSTTTKVDRIVSHITLMDTVKHYFNYEVRCGCGIPSITLTGNVDDWKAVREKAEGLRQFDIDWWLEELLPVLDQFQAAAEGKADTAFWRSICSFSGASGMPGPSVTGWIQVFFPYLNNGENTALGQYRKSYTKGTTAATYAKGMELRYKSTSFWSPPAECRELMFSGSGVKLEEIPPGLSSAPFTFREADGTSYGMLFMGGIVAVVQDPDTLALQPVTGWAVVE